MADSSTGVRYRQIGEAVLDVYKRQGLSYLLLGEGQVLLLLWDDEEVFLNLGNNNSFCQACNLF